MSDQVYDALYSLLADAGLDLVDLEVRPNEVNVFVDRPGGVDLDALAEANRVVSPALDDLDPCPGRYTLNVSSPGLERRLRRPEHFTRAIGTTVTVRTFPDRAEVRRVRGVLAAADETGFTLQGDEVPGGSLRLAYDDAERVRTVFEWGAGERPGRPGPATTKVRG